MYRNITDIAGEFINQTEITEGCTNSTLNASFVYNSDLLYGTEYEIKILTIGCNKTCHEVSEPFSFKTSLKFYLFNY